MTSKNGSSKKTDVLIPQPKRLGVGETESGLVQIEIQLRKFHLFVTEADGFTRFKVSSLATEILKDSDGSEEYENAVRLNMITEVWAPLSVCSSGEVPTQEEFLSLPTTDLAFWVETAKELGHSFDWLDGLNRIHASTIKRMESQFQEEEKKSETMT